MIKILLADDHKLLLEGLKTILDKYNDIEVVGFASDGFEVVENSESLKPDIILMDISMPKLNGLDASKKILKTNPNIKIIMLSMHADRRYIQESLRIGARGYILKEAAGYELIKAIEIVRKGGYFFGKAIQNEILTEYLEMIQDKDIHSDSPLSDREREVLQLVSEGNSTKDIASILNVSIKTIESHRKQIMDKLDLHSVAELTKYAIREGLTQLD